MSLFGEPSPRRWRVVDDEKATTLAFLLQVCSAVFPRQHTNLAFEGWVLKLMILCLQQAQVAVPLLTGVVVNLHAMHVCVAQGQQIG